MKIREVRKAQHTDLDQIYLMGFDVWSEGSTEEDYLNACRTSPKYKKGIWYVLSEENHLLSSLIVYDFGQHTFGIGSIATPPKLRGKGYASALISTVIKEIEQNSDEAIFFLYSDIQPEFYEKFGFVRLLPEGQRYKTTTCMIRGEKVEPFMQNATVTPEYF